MCDHYNEKHSLEIFHSIFYDGIGNTQNKIDSSSACNYKRNLLVDIKFML